MSESTIKVADGADLYEDEPVLAPARVPRMAEDEPEGKPPSGRDRQRKKGRGAEEGEEEAEEAGPAG